MIAFIILGHVIGIAVAIAFLLLTPIHHPHSVTNDFCFSIVYFVLGIYLEYGTIRSIKTGRIDARDVICYRNDSPLGFVLIQFMSSFLVGLIAAAIVRLIYEWIA